MLFAGPPSNRMTIPADEGPAADKPKLEELQIDTGRGRRWLGLAGYVLFFALVAGVLIYLFFQFTDSLKLAFLLVIFMVTYMAVMGWLAMRRNANQGGNLE